MTEYKVEDIPVRGNSKYPFAEMKVGQSFVFPDGEWEYVKSAAYAYGRRNKKTFTVRRVDGAYRCGRVA